jgi:hypothetical protein
MSLDFDATKKKVTKKKVLVKKVNDEERWNIQTL